MNVEQQRFEDQTTLWKHGELYLSERQWETVREDYSVPGEVWDSFSHDQASYRWGEDGILGIADHQQPFCFEIALWNGQEPILKERLFGLIGNPGNHGEDLKEYYLYLDSTPTSSHRKRLYQYPQSAFPYTELETVNRERGPIGFPVHYLPIESIQKFHHYAGDDFRVECSTGSGQSGASINQSYF